MKFRRIMTVGLSLGLVLGSSGNIYAATADYEGHWAHNQISRWLENGWLKGFADGSVKPDQEISRAEFVTLINRGLNITDGSKAAVFSDLPITSWAYGEFTKALGAGYIEGYDGTIRPNAPITRQEAAIIVFRLMKFEAGSQEVLSQFSDSDQIAVWSRSEVAGLVNAGEMKGYPDGRFAPAKALTRAEAIALLDPFTVTTGGLPNVTVNASGDLGGSDPAVLPAANSGIGGGNGGHTTAPAAIPLVSGITVTQGVETLYTNSATVQLNLEELPAAVQAAADHPGYYFTTAAESAPNPANVYTNHLPDMSLRFSFPVSPEHLKDYMTIILYDHSGQAIGYTVVKLDLSAKHAVMIEPIVRFTSGVAITREVRDGLIRDRIAVDGNWIAQHPDVKYFTYISNTQLPYITNATRDFNIKHVSSQILYLEKAENVVYGISSESFGEYTAPLYTVPDFQEQYMIVFYDDEMNVAGYYQGASMLTDRQAADSVAYKINQLPAAANLTVADKKAVNWAYGRYTGLTDAQKALLEAETVNKIKALKAAVDHL